MAEPIGPSRLGQADWAVHWTWALGVFRKRWVHGRESVKRGRGLGEEEEEKGEEGEEGEEGEVEKKEEERGMPQHAAVRTRRFRPG